MIELGPTNEKTGKPAEIVYDILADTRPGWKIRIYDIGNGYDVYRVHEMYGRVFVGHRWFRFFAQRLANRWV